MCIHLSLLRASLSGCPSTQGEVLGAASCEYHVTFHYGDRDAKFDKITSSPFEMKTTSGDVAISGSFPVSLTMCNITYVTTTADYTSLLVHVHNGYLSESRTIQKVWGY